MTRKKAEPATRRVALTKLVVVWSVQQRVLNIHSETVDLYVDALERGEKLPPIVVFEDENGRLIIADGFHRYEAYKAVDRKFISVAVHRGDELAATLFAAGANQRHGLARKWKDVDKTVMNILELKGRAWKDGRIAEHCGVSKEYVRQRRAHIIKQRKEAEEAELATMRQKLAEQVAAVAAEEDATIVVDEEDEETSEQDADTTREEEVEDESPSTHTPSQQIADSNLKAFGTTERPDRNHPFFKLQQILNSLDRILPMIVQYETLAALLADSTRKVQDELNRLSNEE